LIGHKEIGKRIELDELRVAFKEQLEDSKERKSVAQYNDAMSIVSK